MIKLQSNRLIGHNDKTENMEKFRPKRAMPNF